MWQKAYEERLLQTGAISGYLWNFGDGTTSSDTNPVHIFTNAFTYEVVLYATATGGCTDSVKQNLTIKPQPQVSFTSTGFSSPGVTTVFNNASTGASTYLWNFGDGSSTSNLTNPTHTFADTGIYTVTLTAQSSFGCTASYSSVFSVLEPSQDLAIKNISSVLNGTTLTLHAEIVNNGNLNADAYLLQISMEGNNPVLETATDTIEPAQTKNYAIKSQFIINPSYIPNYYCIKILKVNGMNDFVESNNLKCAPLATEFSLSEIAPNPVTSVLNLNYFIPVDDVVTIELYDIRGKKVNQLLKSKQLKGLQQHSFNIEQLSKSVYFCKISYRDTVIKRRFLKF